MSGNEMRPSLPPADTDAEEELALIAGVIRRRRHKERNPLRKAWRFVARRAEDLPIDHICRSAILAASAALVAHRLTAARNLRQVRERAIREDERNVRQFAQGLPQALCDKDSAASPVSPIDLGGR